MVDDAIERPLLVADHERMEHQTEDPACVRERSKLVVGQVARVIVEGATRGVRADHPRALDSLEDLGEGERRRMREVDDRRRARSARPRARVRGVRGHRPRRRRRRRDSADSTSARPCACRAPRTPRRARSRSRTARRPRARASARSARPARHCRGRRPSAPAGADRDSRARRVEGRSPDRAPRAACPRAGARARRRRGKSGGARLQPRAAATTCVRTSRSRRIGAPDSPSSSRRSRCASAIIATSLEVSEEGSRLPSTTHGRRPLVHHGVPGC